MNKLRKICGKILKTLLPRKLYKLIANGAILVPAYYKDIIIEAEKNFDLALEDTDDKAFLLMRKYAHILDKGLHRTDAEPGHSKLYYYELKSIIDKLKNTEYATDPTFIWAKNKIVAYEDLQTDSNFVSLRGEKPIIDISFEQFEKLAIARRSNRFFSIRLISNEQINRLKNLANWASSSCNKQPIEIYATNNPKIAKECLKCCKGGTGFSDFIPSFWVFTANIRGYVWPSEIFLPSVDTCLGVQNVMLGATTLGLSATILSWAQKDKNEEQKLKNLLKIPAHHQIIICAVMGYADIINQTPERRKV